MQTLTRAEVAKRLGKSIATVRRLEYRLFFPARDERGVLRFDEAEIERARRDPSSLRLFARSQWFEEKLRDDSWRRSDVSTGVQRSSNRHHADKDGSSIQLANDLQTALYALLLRFDAKPLRLCGLDADLLARAFDVIRRLRNLGSQAQQTPKRVA